MRLALQIFRKDTERLWRVILLSFVFVAAFAADGSLGWMSHVENAPDSVGGLLNIAVPLMWSFLIALAIHEDPLTGDRQFWVALPCGWQPLVLAKIMFAIAFIQMPYFLASAIILAAHGFNPVMHIPHLLWKQLVLLALILPATALATVVKNIAQFFLAAIAVLACLLVLGRSINMESSQTPSWDVRWVLALSILAAGALAIVTLQFIRRVAIQSRVVGIVMLFAAAGLYSWLSPDASANIHAAFSPAPPAQGPISIQVSPTDPDRRSQRFFQWGVTTVVIPITFTGLSPDTGAHFDQVTLELTNGRGDRLEGKPPTSNSSRQFLAQLESRDPGVPRWQILQFHDAADWNRFRNGPVTIQGRLFAALYHSAEPVLLRANEAKTIDGTGNCSSGSVPMYGPRQVLSGFMAECESPEVASGTIFVESRPNDTQLRALPPYARRNGANGHLREHGPWNVSPVYPRGFWLSPLHWGASFLIGGRDSTSSTDVALIREIPLGGAIVRYTIPHIDLNPYVADESELYR